MNNPLFPNGKKFAPARIFHKIFARREVGEAIPHLRDRYSLSRIFGWCEICGLAMLLMAAALGSPTLIGAGPPAPSQQGTVAQKPADRADCRVKCANLIYATSKSSVCFSEKFLTTLEQETNIIADPKFTAVKLGSKPIFDHPFAVMTGEGTFSLPEQERKNLKSYLTRGGFLLASAGCSSVEWDRSFRAEMKKIFPDREIKKIPMNHPLFQTVYDIATIRLKNGGTASLEGLEMDGKIVMIYSKEGLNDTGSVKGCCCCGGNEVKNSREINTNILAYALTH